MHAHTHTHVHQRPVISTTLVLHSMGRRSVPAPSPAPAGYARAPVNHKRPRKPAAQVDGQPSKKVKVAAAVAASASPVPVTPAARIAATAELAAGAVDAKAHTDRNDQHTPMAKRGADASDADASDTQDTQDAAQSNTCVQCIQCDAELVGPQPAERAGLTGGYVCEPCYRRNDELLHAEWAAERKMLRRERKRSLETGADDSSDSNDSSSDTSGSDDSDGVDDAGNAGDASTSTGSVTGPAQAEPTAAKTIKSDVGRLEEKAGKLIRRTLVAAAVFAGGQTIDVQHMREASALIARLDSAGGPDKTIDGAGKDNDPPIDSDNRNSNANGGGVAGSVADDGDGDDVGSHERAARARAARPARAIPVRIRMYVPRTGSFVSRPAVVRMLRSARLDTKDTKDTKVAKVAIDATSCMSRLADVLVLELVASVLRRRESHPSCTLLTISSIVAATKDLPWATPGAELTFETARALISEPRFTRDQLFAKNFRRRLCEFDSDDGASMSISYEALYVAQRMIECVLIRVLTEALRLRQTTRPSAVAVTASSIAAACQRLQLPYRPTF